MSQCHVCVRWAGRPFTEPSLVGEESNMRLKELLKKRDAELTAVREHLGDVRRLVARLK